jgi:uncharacterized protein (TIGR03083 family)
MEDDVTASDAESDGSAQALVDALRASSEHLHALVAPLDDDALAGPAFPTEWTIADVLSHVGSGAVIMQRRVDDARRGLATPEHFAPSVWDEWNAKSPRAKADDGLAADRALVEMLEQRVSAVADDDPLEFEMGPMTLGLAEFVGLRLNEHALHTWDIEVALDPDATLPDAAAAIAVDNLGLIMSYTARPTGDARTIHVQTTTPARSFSVALTPESAVAAVDAEAAATADVTLAAEAWVRLVYGRLDAEHTPTFTGDATALDTLRNVFPGP